MCNVIVLYKKSGVCLCDCTINIILTEITKSDIYTIIRAKIIYIDQLVENGMYYKVCSTI